jgi:hypothetical protein
MEFFSWVELDAALTHSPERRANKKVTELPRPAGGNGCAATIRAACSGATPFPLPPPPEGFRRCDQLFFAVCNRI